MNHSKKVSVAALCVAIVMVASGCSWTQVQAWFAVRGAAVTEVQAREIADKVNVNEPRNCDPNYTGGCIPTNATAAYCVGSQPADGFPVTIPVRVVGWDHFKLDTDGDGIACPGNSPIGNLDIARVGDDDVVTVSGWALDIDSSEPILVKVTVGEESVTVRANRHRSDLKAAGYRPNAGFTAEIETYFGPQDVCVEAINVGSGTNTWLGCTEVYAWGDGLMYAINEVRYENDMWGIDYCWGLTSDALWMAFYQASPSSRRPIDVYESETAMAYGGGVTARYYESDSLARGLLQEIRVNDPGFYQLLTTGEIDHIGAVPLPLVGLTKGRYAWGIMVGSGGDCR